LSRALTRSARVIALASGKGGVGKTHLAVNLALAFARMGRRSMLVDCDLGLANAAILLGLNAEVTLEDFVSGRIPLEAVVTEGPGGMLFVPGGNGIGAPPPIERAERRRMADGFRPYADAIDYMVIDAPSGISRQTMGVVAASDRVLLVLSGEPTAFVDAYATLKLLALDHGCHSVAVVTNMVEHDGAGRELFRRFRDVAARFLPCELEHLGSIPRDEHLRHAVMAKRPFLDAYPQARASAAMMRLARAIDDLAVPAGAGGTRFFGLEVLHAVQ